MSAGAGQDCTEAQALARQAYEQRRFDQSALYFARALTACGATTPLLLALGQAQLLARHPAEALATLERIPADSPDYVQALKVKAKAQYLLRRDDDAKATLRRAAERAPADAEVPYDLGRIDYQQGRHAEAAELLRRATTLDPNSYKAWDALGLATEALGNVGEAQQLYLKAIALVHKAHPHYDVVYANFADLMIKVSATTSGPSISRQRRRSAILTRHAISSWPARRSCSSGEPTSACAGSSVRSCSTRIIRKRTISSRRPIVASDGPKTPSAR